MANQLNLKEEQINAATWLRSYRQELYTEYGSDFTIKAYMEEVTCGEDQQKIKSEAKEVISRSLSQVSEDPDVITLKEVLSRLVYKWYQEDQAKMEPTNTL